MNPDEMEGRVMQSYLQKTRPSLNEQLSSAIFRDFLTLLRFISDNFADEKPFIFTNEISYMDEIWHEFILHTRLYSDYCQREFGKFLHHEPFYPGSANTGLGSLGLDIQDQIDLMDRCLGRGFVNTVFFVYPEMLSKGGTDVVTRA